MKGPHGVEHNVVLGNGLREVALVDNVEFGKADPALGVGMLLDELGALREPALLGPTGQRHGHRRVQQQRAARAAAEVARAAHDEDFAHGCSRSQQVSPGDSGV